MNKPKNTPTPTETFIAQGRCYLAYAAPDLLVQLLRSCPEAAKWCDEHAQEHALAIIDTHVDCQHLEQFGEPVGSC